MKTKVVPLGRDWRDRGRKKFFYHFEEGVAFRIGVGTGDILRADLVEFTTEIGGETIRWE